MCTRRQGNHDARVRSLPGEGDQGRHGLYYHISFHDLQAASHMTDDALFEAMKRAAF